MADQSSSSNANSSHQITACLRLAANGDEEARNRAYILVREELGRIARSKMSAADQREFSTTMVVNDSYLKLINLREIAWKDRYHFLRFACHVVRQLLTDAARTRNRQKRNSGQQPASFDAIAEPAQPQAPDHVLALHDALNRLELEAPELAEIVELRYYGGWSFAEIADEVLCLPINEVERRWKKARLRLLQHLQADTD
ncbi:MAG: ECF-type sigma factor [Planctomycetaceae bacterium]